jgi:nucleotide-binding universal stress UspA family protein
MKVVVGIEDKVFGEAIVKFIGSQKWVSGTEFRLVHVIETLATCEMIGELASPEAISVLEMERAAVDELLMDLDLKLLKAVPDAQSEQKIVYGSAKERLLDEIESMKADLLIVGSHGRTGITRFLMGSVSMALLSHAPCSVLIVKLPAAVLKAAEAELVASATK